MTDWMEKAACRNEGVDPEWWSDTPGLAVHICRRHCPVRARCDQWAEGKTWHSMVIAGYLRTETWGRSLVQPTESRFGCQKCVPNSVPPPPTRRGFPDFLARVECQRCHRSIPTYPHGGLMRHKHNGEWCE